MCHYKCISIYAISGQKQKNVQWYQCFFQKAAEIGFKLSTCWIVNSGQNIIDFG